MSISIPPYLVCETPYRDRRKKCLIAARTINKGDDLLEESALCSDRCVYTGPDGPRVVVEEKVVEDTSVGPEAVSTPVSPEIVEWARNHELAIESDTFLNYAHRRLHDTPGKSKRRLYNRHIPFIHHSCKPNAILTHEDFSSSSPNAILTHEGNVGRVYACRSIRKGEEITIRYDAYSIEDIEREYGFNCHCCRKCFIRSERRKPTRAEKSQDKRLQRCHCLKNRLARAWNSLSS
jgi:hypothetical protein